MKNRFLLFLFSALSLGISANGAVDVRLSIDSTRTLPGIPVSFAIRVDNNGAAAVTIPACAVLVAHDERGEAFTVSRDAGSVVMPLGTIVTLQQKTSRVYDIATNGTLLQPGWFLDGRLYRPSTYRLQVYLVDRVRDAMVAPDELPSTAWKSNTVTLTVDEPHGIDAVVWAELQRFGKGSWHPMKALTPAGEALAEKIVAEHPDSTYAGWFAPFGVSDSLEPRAERLREWLRHHGSDDVLSDRRKLLLATWDAIMTDGFSLAEPQKSQFHKRQAVAALQAISEGSHSESIRAQAKQKLEELTDQ